MVPCNKTEPGNYFSYPTLHARKKLIYSGSNIIIVNQEIPLICRNRKARAALLVLLLMLGFQVAYSAQFTSCRKLGLRKGGLA